jgi:hypothetical protein
MQKKVSRSAKDHKANPINITIFRRFLLPFFLTTKLVAENHFGCLGFNTFTWSINYKMLNVSMHQFFAKITL